MSDVAIGRAAAAPDIFRPLTVVLLLLVGIVAFAGMLVVGAYAPDLRAGGNGGGNALSNAAVGYAGVVRLAAATGRSPRVVRDLRQWTGDELLVATPESGLVDVSTILVHRGGKPTLLVMPKWSAAKDPDHPDWARIGGLLPVANPQNLLAPGLVFTVERRRGGSRAVVADPDLPRDIRFVAPVIRQVVTGGEPLRDGHPRIAPILSDSAGGILLGQIDGGSVYVLADPDLLDNVGMRSPGNALSALKLLDWLNATGATRIGFDVTLNGLGGSRSPLRLAFDPPFLGATLAIVIVLVLLGVQAFGRFGAPRPRERAIALGKAALVDNSAALVRKARRTYRMGGAYSGVIRDRAVRVFGVSPRLDAAATDAYLDGLSDGARFTDIAAAAANAQNDVQLLAAAQALHAWRRETPL